MDEHKECDDGSSAVPQRTQGWVCEADGALAWAGAVQGAAARMAHRFDASVSTLVTTVAAGAATLAGAEGVGRCHLRLCVGEGVKALEGSAEACRVSAEQLTALAGVLESEAACGSVWGPRVDLCVARQTLVSLCECGLPVPTVSMVWLPTPQHAWSEIGGCCHVRTGVSGCGSVAGGAGLRACVRGDSDTARVHNVVCLRVVDERGDRVECGECDVDVRCVGGSLRSVMVGVEGGVEVGYTVSPPHTALGAVELCVSAFGTRLGGSPWVIPVRVLVVV